MLCIRGGEEGRGSYRGGTDRRSSGGPAPEFLPVENPLLVCGTRQNFVD